MKKYLIGLSALLAMGVAFASGDNFMAKPVSYAAAGTEIGIDVGWGWSNAYITDDTYKGAYNGRNNYYGMVDGGAHVGYNFHPTTNLLMGVELGYKFTGYSSGSGSYFVNDYAKVDFDQTVYQNIVDLLFTTHYYVYKGWNLFGKIGVAGTFQTDPFSDAVTTGTADDSVTNFRLLPEYQVGIGYTWNQKLDLHLSYDHIGSDNLDDFDQFLTTNSIMLGLSYTFPSGM
jgi:hypothetical protein